MFVLIAFVVDCPGHDAGEEVNRRISPPSRRNVRVGADRGEALLGVANDNVVVAIPSEVNRQRSSPDFLIEDNHQGTFRFTGDGKFLVEATARKGDAQQ